MTVYHLTTIGLPNTCTQCATACVVGWYAEHADAAISGKGYCARCVGIESEPAEAEPIKPRYLGTQQTLPAKRKRKGGE